MRRHALYGSLIVYGGLLAGPVAAQVRAPASAPLPASLATHPGWPAANPSDVDTVQHLVEALYAVVSGPAGQPRDWDRYRSLFLPDGRLSVVLPPAAAAAGKPASQGDVILYTPQIYAEREPAYFAANGFYQRSVAYRIEEFGNVLSVWSTYECRHAATDPQPFTRGVNTLQIAHARGRYWIASSLREGEREGVTLPDKYLQNP